MDTAASTLTLAVGGVSFVVSPSSGKVQYSKNEHGEIVLTLESVTGTMVVSDVTTTTSSKTATPSPNTVITPKTSHTRRTKRPILNEEDSSDASNCIGETFSTAKKQRKEDAISTPQIEEAEVKSDDEESLVNGSPCLLDNSLGQPDFSQTQPSSTQEGNQEPSISDHECCKSEQNEPESKVQAIMNTENVSLNSDAQNKEDQEDEDEATISSEMLDEEDVNMGEETSAPQALSEPAPTVAPPKIQEPPSARWGHTWTSIGDDQYLVYGGQGWNAKKLLPETRNDVAIYNGKTKSWCVPIKCEGLARQWHTATFNPERSQLIVVGGEAHHGKHGNTKIEDEVMVLDTEIMLWYAPAITGPVPSGRSGHSATLLGNDLVIIGGVRGNRWVGQVSILDTVRWTWSQPKVTGSSMKPRSYHSATPIGNRIIVFGGNNEDQAFDTVHVLERRADVGSWRWTHPTVRGRAPTARTGHSAVLVDDHTICIYGGWDPNDDSKDDVFGDAFLLDTAEWTWKKLSFPGLLPHAEGALSGPIARVGHGASKRGKDILVFGGRMTGGEFTGDVQVLPLTVSK